MVLAQNVELKYAADIPRLRTDAPLAAGVKVFRGAALELNASGFLENASGSGDFFGFAESEVDNTGGNDGDRMVGVYFSGGVELPMSVEVVAQEHLSTAVVEATDENTFRLETAAAVTGVVVGKPIYIASTGSNGRVLVRFRGKPDA